MTVTRTDYVPPPELTLADFGHVGVVRAVPRQSPESLRRPRHVSWQAMSTIERQRVLEQIGIVTNQAGYLGAHVRTEDGPPVGRWLKKGWGEPDHALRRRNRPIASRPIPADPVSGTPPR